MTGDPGGPGRAGIPRRVVVGLLAIALMAGCDDTLEPFVERDDAVFSMFGYLDLKADTQWVRVTPVRHTQFLDPEALDAVVTLEHLGSGRVVTMHDSLFSFPDSRLGGVAHAHNFWTTEPLQPEASYRLTVERSDGATSTATVVMPEHPDILFVEDNRNRRRGTVLALLQIRAERLLSVETIYDMGRFEGTPVLVAAPPVAESEYSTFPSRVPGMIGVEVDLDTLLLRPGMQEVFRRQFRFAVADSVWPYHIGLSDLEVTTPGRAPSNVANGLGFVGGVATLTIPFDACEPLGPEPDGLGACATEITARTASIEGRVIREPCGDPWALEPIRLLSSTGDGGVIRTWKTGWHGQYRFHGIEPDTDLVLELGPDAPDVHLPRLEEGQEHTVPDIFVAGGC